MKENKLMIGLVGVGTILFHALFWKESLGLNLVLFSLFIIIGNGLIKKSKWNKRMIVTFIGLFLSLFAVFFINSTISIIAAITSLVVFVGFVHHKELRFNWSSLMTVLISVFQLPKFDLAKNGVYRNINLKKWKRYFKLVVLPILVVFVFTLIFRTANPVFDGYLIEFENWASNILGNFFINLSITSILFFLTGFFLTGALLVKSTRQYFVKKDVLKSEDIIRKRQTRRIIINNITVGDEKKTKMSYPPIPILGLKNERLSAVIMLSMVGVLLFVVNTIDIIYVWFSQIDISTKSLTEMVHEGTYLLIFSILLSMLIMLYIFRRNQNFYPKNKLLKQLSYLWILQNGILVISVAIRNHNYITEHGLTHKRIGVYIFLLSTIIGLIFLFFKIRNKKSIYYLMLNNSWAVYTILVVIGLFNWDGIIANYNIKYVEQTKVDYSYLVSLSDNALIAIDQNKEALNKYMWSEEKYTYRWPFTSPKNYYEARITSIKERNSQSVLSWNYSTYSNEIYFKKK